MKMFNYLIEINLYLLVFYAFYVAFLRRETFFLMNRIYLIGSALISMIIPLLNFSWIKSLFVTAQIQQISQHITLSEPQIYNISISPHAQQTLVSNHQISSQQILFWVYGIGVICCCSDF